METTTTHSVSRRLPISCEPCRKRKIKCPRDRRPCQTCLRRGLHADECVYLGRPRLSSEQASGTDASVQKELLERIRNLEDLLQRQIGAHRSPQRSDPESPSVTVTSSARTISDLDRAVESTISRFETPGHVGSLQVSATGHVRYVPVASQWNSVLANNSTSESSEKLETHGADQGDLALPFDCHGPTSTRDLLALLPPARYCDVLKDVYFRVFSPLFHVLHDPTFEEEYRRFRQDMDSVSKGWIGLLFIILAIAVTALDDDDPLLPDLGREKTVGANIKALSARYRSMAMRCLSADSIITRHSVRSLQALVLILYARSHSNLPTWTLLGFAHHVAIAMGCHIDPERFGLGPVECEERRRAWAGLMTVYMIQHTAFGSLDARFLVHDVRLPTDIDDLDLVVGPVREPHVGPTQMTYLLMKFRLYEIAAKICQGIFNPSSRSQLPAMKFHKDITMIQDACNARYLSDTSREPLPAHHMANLNIIYSYINQLCLLLHRPTFHQYFQGEVNGETRNARDRCVEAAKGILAIHRTLVEAPQFGPYKWYTCGLGSFHAFHAAVVLTVTLMHPDNQAEFDETKSLLSDAMGLFTVLSHRSDICNRAVPILQNLITIPYNRRNELPEAHPLSQAQPSPPTNYMLPEPSFMDVQMDSLFAQLQPHYWVSPAAICWQGWDFLAVEQTEIHRIVPEQTQSMHRFPLPLMNEKRF
ncbi:hypothetical protein V8E54_003526 [Elaphomyces granulatus]